MNKKEVLKTAHLARLQLSPDEEKMFSLQLKNIFEHFNKIASVNTKGVEPLVHPLEDIVGTDFSREDVVKKWHDPEKLIHLAPEVLGHEYKVPPVIEE